jgi:UDP-glucose 4-epimerase
LDQGFQVTVLDNFSTGLRENLNPGARVVEMDITDAGLADFLAAEDFDVVNHHAAQVSVPASVADPGKDLEINGRGALNLIDASSRAGARRFIFISSGGAVYGEQEHLPISENALPRPMSPYAAHKLLGESYLPSFAETRGLAWVVLRYANVYGPRQAPHAEAGVAAIFTDRILAGKPATIFRYPDMARGMIRDYVFVGDVVRANLAALTRGEGLAFNIGTGRASSTQDLYEALARAAGRNADFSFGPPRPGDIRRSVVEISRARRVLGWEPQVDLDQGCRLTVEWRRRKNAAGDSPAA